MKNFHPSTAAAEVAFPLHVLAWTWLGAGGVAMALFPGLRGHDALLGWLPFWLVIAPLVDLALLHRSRLTAVSRALLVRARHRRRPPRRQARRRMPHRRARLRPLLAALLSR